MQQCCHLSTYIVPFHTRKGNRNFTKKRGAESQRFRRILGDFDKKHTGEASHIVQSIQNVCSYCGVYPEHTFGTIVRFLIQNVCSLCQNIRSCSRLSGFRTNVRCCIEQTFFIYKNIRSLLQEQAFGSLANICSFIKERLFAGGQTKSPSRRRGNFIQFDVITE